MQNPGMGMQQIIRLIGRGCGWLALVLITVNVEHLAAALGYDRLLSESAYFQWLSEWIWPVLTSDVTFYVALIMLGIGIAAWGDHFARKWDGSHPTNEQQSKAQSMPLYELARDLENVRHSHWEESIPTHLYAQLLAQYEILRKLGFSTPSPEISNRQRWAHLHAEYCSLLWPLLDKGQVDVAKRNSAGWSKNIDHALSGKS